MALIRANRGRGITKDLTITKADDTIIIPGSSDKLRVIIGREGRLGTNFDEAELVVTSDAATANGSTLTKDIDSAGKNRLRLDASDLNFSPGAYSFWFEMFDYEDAEEWKLVSKQVFYLEE